MGASRSLADNWQYPLDGLRHPPEGDTSGWHCWVGDWLDAEDFVVPLHQRHLVERIPELGEYLGMPLGSRFLLAPGYVDTWHDASLRA